MVSLTPRGATINRLRMRCRLDPAAARLRASSLLDEADLQPVGLAPSAILCIRRLVDPRPGLVPLDGLHRPPRAWSDLVSASVATLARSAQRPAQGEVAADAEAVIFADRAEMLACLAADWCARRLLTRWWSRALLKGVGDTRAVPRLWLESLDYVAASLDELARQGAATTFVERLSASETYAFLNAVVVQHGLRHLAPVVDLTAGASPPEARNTADEHEPASMPSGPGQSQADRSPSAPWADWVPESRGLRADHQCLLGVALMTRRAPTAARSARFAADVRQWLSPGASGPQQIPEVRAPASADDRGDERRIRGETSPIEPATGSPARPAQLTMTSSSAEHEQLRGTERPHDSSATPLDASEPRADGDEDLRPPGGDDELTGARPHLPAVVPVADTRRGQRIGRAVDSQTSVLEPESSSARPFEPSIAPRETVEPREVPHPITIESSTTDTQIGGVFYLLNVAIGLGLYGDFTTPLKPGLDLSIWDFLTLVGRRSTRSRFRSDPLWSLLAALAGRSSENEPGAGFDTPDVWRIPPDWLDAFQHDGAWRWFVSSGRLRVVHPAGFTVIEVPRAAGVEAHDQAERELAAYGATATLQRGRAGRTGRRGLSRWLGWLLPYLHARLARALGETDRRRAGTLLCVHRATVLTTPARIDVRFSLAALPIAVRLSGLDCNPGWIPAAGRSIAFHYD